MDFEPPGSSASSCSGTSSFELLSSHVHRLQIAFDRAESARAFPLDELIATCRHVWPPFHFFFRLCR